MVSVVVAAYTLMLISLLPFVYGKILNDFNKQENSNLMDIQVNMHEIDFSKGSHRCHIFNQHAMAFVPLNKLDKHDDVITIITVFLLTIFLFLLSIFRTFISNNKGDHDEYINPKETLRTIKNVKNDNPHKMIIGRLNINSTGCIKKKDTHQKRPPK